jgi:hypothetical protein
MDKIASRIMGKVVDPISSEVPRQMNASERIEIDVIGDVAGAIGGVFAVDRSRSCGQGNVIHQGRG